MTPQKTNTHSGSWILENGKLILRHPDMDIFWEVPQDFWLPSDSVLSLAEYLLLKPYNENVEIISADMKKHGRVAMAFSGGVDSSAGLELLPNAIPIYTQVSRPKGMHKIENALKAVSEVGGISVKSNYDEFSLTRGRRSGYFGVAGFTITCVIFSEYYNIGTICDGNVLEMVYLGGGPAHGTKFREPRMAHGFDAFRKAGLQYCMPCAGLTEVCTTKLASHRKYAMGCMRGEGGVPCDKCMKCFRKNALQGREICENPEVNKKLAADLIPMLPSLLWARGKYDISHPSYEQISKPIQWTERWYPKSLALIPSDLQDFFKQRLEDHHISEMNGEDIEILENWSSEG